MLVADGAFVIDTADFSYDDAILLLNKLKTVFGTNQISIGVSLMSGAISLSTSPLTPGDYVLLMGVYDVMTSRIVGVSQRTVKVYSPAPPPPPPVIPVNKPPVADAGPDQTAYVDETVYFDGSGSKDPDGSIISYKWDFGDGGTATGETSLHTYSTPGNYTVTLTVKDNMNAEGSDTCLVTVRETPTPPPPPPLPPVLSNLTITPTEVEPGQEVTISFNIENVEDQSFTYIITMYVGEHRVLIDVTLEPYESKIVTHTITRNTVGDYDVTVDGLTGSFTVKSLPKPPRPAEFIVSDLTISPTEVLEGEEVTVSVTITNIGEIMGTHTLEIRIAGKPEGPPIETTLIGGTFTTVTIKVIKPRGDYLVEVDGLIGSFKVLPTPFWMNPYYIVGILILIVAVITLYILYRRGLLPLPRGLLDPKTREADEHKFS